MWLFDLIVGSLPYYRASADASHGIHLDGSQVNHYLSSMIIDKARRDRERAKARRKGK